MKPIAIVAVAAMVALGACATVDQPCVEPVPAKDAAQIARAMQRAGYAAVKSSVHRCEDPPRSYHVWTVDGYEFVVTFVGGKWDIKEFIIVT